MSLLLSEPEKEIDSLQLIQHIGDADRLIAAVLHQQSVCRKSFITPSLEKSLKQTLDAIILDKCLSGAKCGEFIKDAQTVEKLSARKNFF